MNDNFKDEKLNVISTVDAVDNVSNIEEISIDSNGNIDPASLEYNEYRNDLNRIYTTTTDENSLNSNFVVQNGKCYHNLTIQFSNGTVSVEKDREFDYTESFKNNFLVSMLEDYNKYNSIFNDNVIIKENGNATFIARTKDNDNLIIDNIDIDLASKLSDIVYIKDSDNPNLTDSREIKRSYQKGIGNVSIIILTLLLIGITLVGTLFFTIMANK